MSGPMNDDQALGDALSRSIADQRPNATPFERSRLASQVGRSPRRFSGWAWAAAAAVVMAIALTPILFRPPQLPPATSGEPDASASPVPASVPYRVYFGRDEAPPVAVTVNGESTTTIEQRIAARVNALLTGPSTETDPDVSNVFAGTAVRAASVRVEGDLATVDFAVPPAGWRIAGTSMTLTAIGQLIYTVTEEPGIRRAMLTENGGTATIDQAQIDSPRSREQVFGYSSAGEPSVAMLGEEGAPLTLTHRWSVEEISRALARITLDTGLAQSGSPSFTIDVRANDERADPAMSKWVLTVHVPNARLSGETTTVVDRTPLRAIRARANGSGVDYELGLDDLRPWRASVAHDPVRIVIDVGGEPQSVRGWDAVYQPARFGVVTDRTVRVVGSASHFEANVQFRVRDASGVIVARGFTTASQCCLPGGLYEATIELPANVSGNVTLESYAMSPQDGSDLNVIAVPIEVR